MFQNLWFDHFRRWGLGPVTTALLPGGGYIGLRLFVETNMDQQRLNFLFLESIAITLTVYVILLFGKRAAIDMRTPALAISSKHYAMLNPSRNAARIETGIFLLWWFGLAIFAWVAKKYLATNLWNVSAMTPHISWN